MTVCHACVHVCVSTCMNRARVCEAVTWVSSPGWIACWSSARVCMSVHECANVTGTAPCESGCASTVRRHLGDEGSPQNNTPTPSSRVGISVHSVDRMARAPALQIPTLGAGLTCIQNGKGNANGEAGRQRAAIPGSPSSLPAPPSRAPGSQRRQPRPRWDVGRESRRASLPGGRQPGLLSPWPMCGPSQAPASIPPHTPSCKALTGRNFFPSWPGIHWAARRHK